MSSPSSSNVQMDSKSTPTLTAKYHTPFCPSNCNLSHHDLVAAMFMDGRYAGARIQRSGDLPIALMQRIESAKLSGWDQDSDIPDPLEELRCPLLFLACAFGKTGIVKGLLRNNFNPRAVNQHGETALHFAQTHLNKAAAFSSGKLVRIKDREEAFDVILDILTDYHPKILAAKDKDSRTVFHVAAANMILNRSPDGRQKKATFYQFCFKSMIKKLIDLEDAALFTRNEVIEIINTAEAKSGDSVLHMLARDSLWGFEVLKFVQLLLFSEKSMADGKNKQNETVVSLAWATDPRNAVKIFSLSPAADKTHPRLSHQESSTHNTSQLHEEETLISTDNALNPESHCSSSDLEERDDLTEGNPFPQLTVPLFNQGNEDDFHALTHSDDSVPCITRAFSLSSEDLSQCTSGVSDSNKKPKDLSTPGKVEIKESSTEVEATRPSKVKTCSDADNSFLEFVITEGVALDVVAKQNIVGVVLKQYLDKLDQVEERLPKLGQLMSEEEMAISQKKEELALLKKEIVAKERSLEELRQNKELLCEEKKKLKRKVAHCEATQQQLEGNNYLKRGRSD
ncbi:hypothetical protein ACROYT_G010461 [Oculina patagonica]